MNTGRVCVALRAKRMPMPELRNEHRCFIQRLKVLAIAHTNHLSIPQLSGEMPFSMRATAKYVVTRATGDFAQSVQKRARIAPPAAHLTDIELPARAAIERIPETAAMALVVYKVSDYAGDTTHRYRGAIQAQLFEVMMEHHACPSLLHNLKNEFDEFLKHAHHTCLHGDEVPTSLEDMNTAAGMPFCVWGGALCSVLSCFHKSPTKVLRWRKHRSTSRITMGTRVFPRDGRLWGARALL